MTADAGEALTHKVRKYIALGDSVSIDLYPNRDAADRRGRIGKKLGAPSLLYRNDDDMFPEFAGLDLQFGNRHCAHINLAEDGATIEDVDQFQVQRIRATDADLITLSVGGNDLLWALRSGLASDLADRVTGLAMDYVALIAKIHRLAPRALVVLTTVYDPTDGTGALSSYETNLPLDLLHHFNDGIREAAESHAACTLADVYAHFQGHGMRVPVDERWYWSGSIIEPSLLGASEVRRVWLDALRSAA